MGTFISYLFIAFIIYAVILIARNPNRIQEVISHWHHLFDTPPFSSQDFYQAVQAAVETKEVKGVTFLRVVYSEGGIFTPNREYLRVKYYDYAFDICAAPFGNGYFVSWWLGELETPFFALLMNIPLIGGWFRKRDKTFFELDTETMFKETVSHCIKEVVEKLTEERGQRKLSDADWNIYNRQYKS